MKCFFLAKIGFSVKNEKSRSQEIVYSFLKRFNEFKKYLKYLIIVSQY